MDLVERRIRHMTAADLGTVLGWRNHPDVRRYMYTQHKISLDEHLGWFERASQDPQRHLLIFEDGQNPLGFISIHQIAPGKIADWGFYAAPDAPKGTGNALGNAALWYAFVNAGLHKICGQTIAFNERAIKFHQKLGFKQEGILRQQHYSGNQYHDVLYFGLIAEEWRGRG